MVNNLDWLGELSLIDFLRDTGKHFTVPYMLSKDSVQVRLDRGLSFTEFSYMLLQAYDFWHLHRTRGVELQMGGADQWGNITAGLELIRRTTGVGEDAPDQPAHGLAYKLLLSPSGSKFGKSVAGDSIWLDPARTIAVRVLPVLAQHRRPRRRDVPALVHRVPARAGGGPRGRADRTARGACGAAGARPRHHGTDAWRGRRRPGRDRQRRAVLGCRDLGSGRAAVAVRVDRGVHVRARRPVRRRGAAPGRRRRRGVARRGAPADRRRRRDRQRRAGDRSGERAGAWSPASGWTSGSGSAGA